jgi:DNA polymerase (family 10)
MSNTAEISEILELTSKLMELHGENEFKARALKNAAYRIYKNNIDLSFQTKEELEKMELIGKSLAAKIVEFRENGSTKELNKLLEKTPPGVIDMLGIKGLGPKKVAQLWKELEIESVGELYYACNENRLTDLKGFGEKSQESVKESIEFKQANSGKYHYARIIDEAEKIVSELKEKFNTPLISLTGEIYRKCEVLEKLEILIGSKNKIHLNFDIKIPVIIYYCDPDNFFIELVKSSSNKRHWDELFSSINEEVKYESEEEVYNNCGIQFVIPEQREGSFEIEASRNKTLNQALHFSDLRGALHNHSKYSDGQNTIEEMALRCKEIGLEYFGIADHSQSAFYAGGLKPEKIIEQHEEIDRLNEKLYPFKIFKGIESDILNDGSLDYEEDVLKKFDYVVASIHSNLKMNEEKAMVRLIRAIENPYTTILGHPTGRLLLARPGYPINHEKIIDACAANGVSIELNAHPFRLDIDWKWIPYCMNKGVMISINPDAHHVDGLTDMHFGVYSARKGNLSKDFCLNAKNLEGIEKEFSK